MIISARRIIAALGTVFLALLIGFTMQTFLQGDREAPEVESVQVASVAGIDGVLPLVGAPAEQAVLTSDALILPMAATHPQPLPETPIQLAALHDVPIGVMPREEPAPTFACEVVIKAEPQAAAMVQIGVEAPCLPQERYILRHSGLIVSDVTDEQGHASLTVPALEEDAEFTVAFDSGAQGKATVQVSSIEYYDRAIVQWSGPEGFQMHALEYGADYGEPGHIWQGATPDLAVAARGKGGFVAVIGGTDILNPRRAEVYTFPTGTAQRSGTIEVSVEAEVTAANCNRDMDAQVLRKSGVQPMKVYDLTLAFPNCAAEGEFLVLKNLLDDLNIAQN